MCKALSRRCIILWCWFGIISIDCKVALPLRGDCIAFNQFFVNSSNDNSNNDNSNDNNVSKQ